MCVCLCVQICFVFREGFLCYEGHANTLTSQSNFDETIPTERINDENYLRSVTNSIVNELDHNHNAGEILKSLNFATKLHIIKVKHLTITLYG